MGLSRVTEVIDALQGAGIRADRGYPAAAMPEPAGPVAAVSVEKLTAEETTLAVMVYTTAAQGGILCEDTAYTVAQVLKKMHGVCTVGSCGFSGRTGLFSVRVLAAFPEMLPYPVKMNGQTIPYITGFSARQTVEQIKTTDSETGEVGTARADQGWRLTLIELLPADTALAAEPEAAFTLTVERPGSTEQYPNCYWEQVTLEDTHSGLRRTRVAHTWSASVVAVG